MAFSRRIPHRSPLIDANADTFASLSKSHLTEQPLDRNRLHDFDYLTLGLTFLLVALGLLTIYSTTYSPEAGGWLTAYCRRQATWFAIALVVGGGLFIFHYI